MKTAAEMVDLLSEVLATGMSVSSVTIDGRIMQYDRKQALQELKYWRRRAYLEAGGSTSIRQRIGSFELDGTSIPHPWDQ
jgi:hypothetical protein